ncbi:MAG: tRNA (adenosine(37)-N6)-threonylcarbamoyltransferase complex dimerization subunit type 1 TsaB [Parcubacteria group bacterium CG_4_10_14_0_2_um_filter_41_6]|nr:MAG: tRNA (adenosine(37)-N6)-threonylcarbamoyltransferase complex dimerization subunit type 1 TsaB [Parcubacteria group bacterium CG_4_10_14_0_2_um_filter_41_6]
MHLFIDTTEKESFDIALLDEARVIKKKRIKSIRQHSEKLLKSIDALLLSAKSSLKDIQGIIAVKGPGSFTSLRIGIATANALAFALGVGIAGVDKTDDLGKIVFQSKTIFKGKRKFNIIVPEYGREPDIT